MVEHKLWLQKVVGSISMADIRMGKVITLICSNTVSNQSSLSLVVGSWYLALQLIFGRLNVGLKRRQNALPKGAWLGGSLGCKPITITMILFISF